MTPLLVFGFVQAILVSLAVSAAVSGGSFVLGKLFGGKKKKEPPPPPPVAQAPNPLELNPATGGPLPCLMGYRRVAGKIHMQVKWSNKTYVIIVIAGHRVNAVPGVYVNNALVSIDGSGNVLDKPWANGTTYSMNVRIYTGAQTTVDTTLNTTLPNWTANFVGKETTYAIITMNPSINSTLFAETYSGGIPSFSFDVIGANCYDPRNGAHNISDPTTWTFSSNASIIEANYIIHSLGMNRPTSSVDWDSVEISADVDDENVTLANGGSERRYSAALYWETNERHEDVLERIGAAHAGGIRFRGNKWVSIPGEFPTSLETITPDSYAGDGITITEAPPLERRVNGVRGQFVSPQHNWEMKDFPAYQNATHLTEDDGSPQWLDIKFDCVTSHSQAQRLARIAYNRARLGHTARVTTKMQHFDVVADDIVTLTDSYAGLSAVTFRVTADSLNAQDWTIDFDLEYEAASFYDWTAATDEEPFEATTPVSGEIGPERNVGFTLYDSTVGGSIVINAAIWHPPSFPIGADNYAFYNASGGTLLWTGPLTSNVTASASAFGAASNLNFQMRIRDAAGATLQSVTVTPGAQIGTWVTEAEATSTKFALPGAPRPIIKSFFAGTVVLSTPAPACTKVQAIELWGHTSNSFGSATLISTNATPANATFTVTGAAATFKYYWLRYKHNTGPQYGQESSPLLVVFS